MKEQLYQYIYNLTRVALTINSLYNPYYNYTTELPLHLLVSYIVSLRFSWYQGADKHPAAVVHEH